MLSLQGYSVTNISTASYADAGHILGIPGYPGTGASSRGLGVHVTTLVLPVPSPSSRGPPAPLLFTKTNISSTAQAFLPFPGDATHTIAFSFLGLPTHKCVYALSRSSADNFRTHYKDNLLGISKYCLAKQKRLRRRVLPRTAQPAPAHDDKEAQEDQQRCGRTDGCACDHSWIHSKCGSGRGG